MQGDAILICRYLHPQKPPLGVNTFTKVARFVSLIPFLDDWQSFGCSNLDVWCTSQEFLDIGAGDWEEHGILLHNFMWWLQLHAKSPADDPSNLYLVIGSGIPEGNTIYVMQCHDYCSAEKIMLWNSCTGGMSHAAEKICPLIDIGCLVSSSNIYANIQAMTSLRLISFNYLNKELWRPLFADDLRGDHSCGSGCFCICNPGPVQMCQPSNLHSIQDPKLRYDAPDIIRAEQIQESLTNEIKVRHSSKQLVYKSQCADPVAPVAI